MLSRGSPAGVICRGLAVLILSGLAGATLVRLAPGFGVDDQALDPRRSVQTLEARERAHDLERNPLAFYVIFLGNLLHGNLGRSSVFGQPVRDLISDRMFTTVWAVVTGLIVGWCAAVLLACVASLKRHPLTVFPAFAVSGSLLSLPSAFLATLCLLLNLPTSAAIAAVVFPRVFPHAYEQLRAALAAPHVIMARASGIPGARVFFLYALPSALPLLLALGGVSVTLAFGASIPIEALSDAPGLGSLAWRAALGRDLPVLVTVTLLLTAITVCCNVAADLTTRRFGRLP